MGFPLVQLHMGRLRFAMPAPRQVLDLISRFSQHLESYKTGQYNETQLRRDFLDPFFRHLGWDMDNELGHAEAYRDVIHEDAVRVMGALKAPDYGFSIGGSRKFFLEAKKPSVRVKDEAGPAYQLRRYAWSAKLPLSILSDFEEFAVYDCRAKPSPDDPASASRIFYCQFHQYADHWDWIESVFSKQAVLKGSFDQFAVATKGKRGTTEVDDDFLATIEGWREALARNLALRNPTLTQRELNFAVQRVIDRIIFLRICEDRGIEDYGRLRQCVDGTQPVYPQLVEFFRDADDRYNSGLFHFQSEKNRNEEHDVLTPTLAIDDDLLKRMVRGLYYPESPYEFRVLSADILGQVYEQFLGKVIRLTDGHKAKIEEKPEVKKSGGVFYTPAYIVEYIVQQTLGRLVQGKSPRQVADLRVLDPACGSGSFLIGAYQFLLDWYHAYYSANGPEKLAKGKQPVIFAAPGGGWALTTSERKRILLAHVYGVDIDSQAVEVTKLSLLLKVLEGETAQSVQRELIHDRVLPDLGHNIKCGNSLVGSDYYQTQLGLPDLETDAQFRVNAFDWQGRDGFPEVMKSGGFDVVIGNPPYDVMEKERGNASWPHDVLARYAAARDEYQAAMGGKLNLFRFFVVRSVHLTKLNGAFGMIIPLSLMADISCAATRRFLLTNIGQLEADCFPQKDNADRRVFRKAKLSTMVVFGLRRRAVAENKAGVTTRVYPGNRFDEPARQATIALNETRLLDSENLPIPLVSADQWSLCVRLHQHPSVKRLAEFPWFKATRGEINQTVYADFIDEDPSHARLLKGVEIGRYTQHRKLSQGKFEWFDERRFLANHAPKAGTLLRRIATQRITGVDERLRIVATIVEPPCYFADSTNSIHAAGESPMSLEYLLALLNSRLMQWRFKLTSTNNNVGTNELNSLPIRGISASQSDKDAHRRIVQHVNELTSLLVNKGKAKTPQEMIALARRIAAIDTAIDAEVYGLYELSESEIALVEQTQLSGSREERAKKAR